MVGAAALHRTMHKPAAIDRVESMSGLPSGQAWNPEQKYKTNDVEAKPGTAVPGSCERACSAPSMADPINRSLPP
jgi:hypothetical protein